MERVGQRVQVYWPDEQDWFGGHVQDFDDDEGYFVVYDDGDERWEADVHLIRFQDHDAQGDGAHDEDEREAGEAGTGADYTREDEGDDGGDDDGTDGGDDAGGSANREALEPPESPTGAYDDDYEDVDDAAGEDSEAMSVPRPQAPPADHEVGNDCDSDPEVEVRPYNGDIKDGVLSDGDTNSEDEESGRYPALSARDPSRTFRVREIGDLSDIDDELEQSIAASEVPETCAVQREGGLLARVSPPGADRLVPECGRLYGKVLRASELPLVSGHAPTAFVKVSFAEAGDASGASSLMLRCKQTLISTPIAAPSADPVWIEEEHEQDWSVSDFTSSAGTSSHFQLDLVPPKPSSMALWDRVLGDLVFAVYSMKTGAQNVFLGQAVVSLQDLLRGLLSRSPSMTRCLRLCTRSGKSLPSFSGSVGATELVVAFHFAPTFTNEVKRRQLECARSLDTIKSDRSRHDDAKNSSRARRDEQKQQLKAGAKTWARQRQPNAPSKSASSGINRKRFERQVAKENVDFAKRLEWKNARRSKLKADAKAQEKNRVTPPQHGARKHGHKASSDINRTKFVEQVSLENRVLGKRLHAIGSSGAKACKPSISSQPRGFGGREQDKACAADKRQERRLELDFRMQQAQVKYVQQNQLVAEVTTLQDDVAQLKQQMGELSRGCSRLDALNRKDRHTRDCLRVAAEKERAAVARGVSKQPKAPPSQRASSKRDAEQPESGGDVMRQRECELLEKERDRLEAEKQRHREQLLALEQEHTRLGDAARALEATLRGVLAQRAFSSDMRGGKNPAQAQAKTEQMKRRLRAKDLSKEEEEQWALFQAHEELAQLQLAVQVLKQRASASTTATATRDPRDSSSAATAYLTGKIERATSKLQAQQAQQAQAAGWRRECEALVSAGKYETLRAQVQELQHLVFLCRSQSTHQRRAECHADRTQRRMEADFERRVQAEQTETEVVLKKTAEG